MSDPGDPSDVPYGMPFDQLDMVELMKYWNHGSWLNMGFHAMEGDWLELSLPWNPDIVADRETGVLASGPIISLLDIATGMAVARKRGVLLPQVTVDLRIDYMRPARPGRTVIGRGECYLARRSIAFVRGIAYDETPDDPVAHTSGTFILMGENAK